MKNLETNYKKIKLGTVNNESIFLSPPSWDCGWYWGFGYLGNKNCHYHLDGLSKECNLFDGIKKHFGDSFIIKDEKDIWTFAELIQTFYHLKESAEVFGRGGSHYTTNPCKDIIINKEIVATINNIVIPAIFEQIYKILDKYTK
jgi:hypothetical protein